MRAAAYIRVSTEKQAAEEKVSLTEQRKDIDAYCEDRAYSIVEVYQDVGSGASKRRRDFQRMLKDAQAGHFDVIVCWHHRVDKDPVQRWLRALLTSVAKSLPMGT